MTTFSIKFEEEVPITPRPVVGCCSYMPDGTLVYVTSGSYMGGYERVSNLWEWRKVNADGTLISEKYNGYGW